MDGILRSSSSSPAGPPLAGRSPDVPLATENIDDNIDGGSKQLGTDNADDPDEDSAQTLAQNSGRESGREGTEVPTHRREKSC